MNLKKYLEEIAQINLIPSLHPTSGILNVKIKFNDTIASFAIPNGEFTKSKLGTYNVQLSQISPNLKAVINKERPDFKMMLMALDNFPQDTIVRIHMDKMEIFFDTQSSRLMFK